MEPADFQAREESLSPYSRRGRQEPEPQYLHHPRDFQNIYEPREQQFVAKTEDIGFDSRREPRERHITHSSQRGEKRPWDHEEQFGQVDRGQGNFSSRSKGRDMKRKGDFYRPQDQPLHTEYDAKPGPSDMPFQREQRDQRRGCGNCGQPGHKLSRCVAPVDEYGFIDGCPRCDTKGHTYSSCPVPQEERKERDDWHFLIRCRENKPPIRWHRDIREIPRDWRGQSMPWTWGYSIEQAAKRYWDDFEYPRFDADNPAKLRDPTWENPRDVVTQIHPLEIRVLKAEANKVKDSAIALEEEADKMRERADRLQKEVNRFEADVDLEIRRISRRLERENSSLIQIPNIIQQRAQRNRDGPMHSKGTSRSTMAVRDQLSRGRPARELFPSHTWNQTPTQEFSYEEEKFAKGGTSEVRKRFFEEEDDSVLLKRQKGMRR